MTTHTRVVKTLYWHIGSDGGLTSTEDIMGNVPPLAERVEQWQMGLAAARDAYRNANRPDYAGQTEQGNPEPMDVGGGSSQMTRAGSLTARDDHGAATRAETRRAGQSLDTQSYGVPEGSVSMGDRIHHHQEAGRSESMAEDQTDQAELTRPVSMTEGDQVASESGHVPTSERSVSMTEGDQTGSARLMRPVSMTEGDRVESKNGHTPMSERFVSMTEGDQTGSARLCMRPVSMTEGDRVESKRGDPTSGIKSVLEGKHGKTRKRPVSMMEEKDQRTGGHTSTRMQWMPPEFDGKPDEYGKWIGRLTGWLIMVNGGVPAEQWAPDIREKLSGPAATAVEHIPPEILYDPRIVEGSDGTIKARMTRGVRAIVEALEENGLRRDNKTHLKKIQKEFRNMKRTQGTSVEDFVIAYKNKADELRGNGGETTRACLTTHMLEAIRLPGGEKAEREVTMHATKDGTCEESFAKFRDTLIQFHGQEKSVKGEDPAEVHALFHKRAQTGGQPRGERQRPAGKRQKGPPPPDVVARMTCYACNQKGHLFWMRDKCPKAGEEDRNRSRPAREAHTLDQGDESPRGVGDCAIGFEVVQSGLDKPDFEYKVSRQSLRREGRKLARVVKERNLQRCFVAAEKLEEYARFGILDTGCQVTVCGTRWLRRYLKMVINSPGLV